ncbi:winged helix DNA-binding domain-containing protein [Actinomadura litoris]|uniref:winged helix DNA-binding domain-containing protein n=1 Tax=Actinomadura litoris TaxID=2678616 RepID=UPI001FA70E11|nr:winged helix DNA-binding domain-containing protein [Actinomadura litoris]
MPRTIDRRTLNRTTLDRQLLLARSAMPPLSAVERLVALQAQDPNLPYYGLWSRLTGFRQKQLTDLLHDRSVVRSSILRGTQHLAAADDFRYIRPLVQRSMLGARQAAFGRVTKDWDLDELAARTRGLLAGRTLTRPQLARALAEIWPGRDLQALGWSAQALVPVVHPPPSGTWNTWGATPFALPEDWIGEPPQDDPTPDRLIHRYLAAFGPASVKDFQMWSGMRRMDADFDRLRPDLRVYHDENGVELFDLPDAALVEDAPAPIRFLPDLDNLLLAYADRSRVMTAEQRAIICVGAWVKATVLVDGRTHGIWNLKHDRKAQHAALTIETFAPLPDEPSVREEAEALLRFAAPDSDHEIRITPLQ